MRQSRQFLSARYLDKVHIGLIEPTDGEQPADWGGGERRDRAIIAVDPMPLDARGKVPSLNAVRWCVVVAARQDQRLAVGRKGDGLVLSAGPFELAGQDALGRVPQRDLVVITRGYQRLVIWREGKAEDRSLTRQEPA